MKVGWGGVVWCGVGWGGVGGVGWGGVHTLFTNLSIFPRDCGAHIQTLGNWTSHQ